MSDSTPARSDSAKRISDEKKLLLQSVKVYRSQLNHFRWQRNMLLAVSGVLLLLFLYIFRRSRNNILDIRALHRAVSRLETLHQSKDQLFSIVSHDLRAAVHALQINVSRIKALLGQSMITEALLLAENTEQITASTQSLLNNLLYWSLSQAGRVNYHFEPVALKPLAEQVCYDFRPVAASKMIELVNTVSFPVGCTGDANSIKIILRNLIDNALKYTPPQGRVTISAQQDEQYCRITITDTGIGMEEETVKAVLAGGSNRIQPDAYGRRSTGLGLWLVKELTAKNGGRLSILSKKGVGTHITIAVPAG